MRSISTILLTLSLVFFAGCETTPTSSYKRQELSEGVQGAIARFKAADPSIVKFFNSSAGYAVFPSVGKGAIGVGGAYGRGELHEKGTMVGYCDLSQASIGFQLGGQTYAELIFFEDSTALNDFKGNNLAFSANASAVAAKAGASATADYDRGVLVFTMTKGGLMFEASIGGQKFTYEPKSTPAAPISYTAPKD